MSPVEAWATARRLVGLSSNGILHECRLQRFAQMKKQLDSLDKDTIRQVDSACKEISRNCELLSIVKQDLDTIYRTTR